MKAIEGYWLITPDDLAWRPSNLMRIPNADYLERTGSEILGARLWRLPPQSANTLHKHIHSEEFYVVLEGTGRIRVGDETVTVPRYGGVLVGPDQVRQVFNDTHSDALWLIVGAPEELEFLKGSKSQTDLSLFYPTDPAKCPRNSPGWFGRPRTQRKHHGRNRQCAWTSFSSLKSGSRRGTRMIWRGYSRIMPMRLNSNRPSLSNCSVMQTADSREKPPCETISRVG